jgi:acyl-CoA synthetase (NDP forming)
MPAQLDGVFRARSVALVGLSSDAKKMTGAPLDILKQTGFAGHIYPVNPRHAEIGGLTAYPSIAALPETPDVAMIMLPASACAQAVRDCAAKGIGACVIPSSGFEESEQGAADAQALRDAAAQTGMAVVGPNCEGLWSVRSRVLLTFGSAARRSELHHAPIAILSQSGAMAGAMARHLQNDRVGCA